MSDADLSRLRIDRDAEPVARPRRRGTVVLLALMAGALATGGFFLWRGRSVPEIETIVVPAPLGGAGALQAAGFVVAQRRASISSKVPGLIIEVNVSTGDRVEKDFVVARLDDRDYVAERDRLQVQLELARTEEQRIEKLVKTDTRAEIELERARAATRALELQLRAAQIRVDDTRIRAPFAGVVTQKNAEVGESVSMTAAAGPGLSGALATIVDPSSLQAVVDLNEAYKERIRPGMPAQILLEGMEPLAGRVNVIVPMVDRAKATVAVKVTFDAPDARVLDGMTARVRFLEAAEQRREPILLPAASVRRERERTFVWTVVDGALRSRDVITGAERDGKIEIREGLGGGERVVARPEPGLRESQEVRAQP
jgi:RND family efflux transporter MFP subunit